MLKPPDTAVSRSRRYRGSALLDSSARRFMRVLIVVVLLWALTGWAMDWWQMT